MASGDKEKNVSDEDNNTYEMQSALMNITNEIIRLSKPLNSTSDETTKYHEYVFKKIILSKTKLISRKKMIIKLKESLNTAIFVARTLMNTKKKEVLSLHVNIKRAERKIEDITESDKGQSQKIKSLTKEINVIRDELAGIKKLIDNAYQQLQICIDKPPEQISSITKLRNILSHSGQKCADFFNVNQKYEQMIRKNRYLNTKLNIIGQNLEVTTSELWNYRNQILRLQNENNFLRNKTTSKVKPKFCSCLRKSQSENTNIGLCLDLESHMHLVKELLNDQDQILSELTWLSRCDFKND